MSAVPRSEEAPATRTSSPLMDPGPDLRLRDGLSFAVDDGRLDLHAPERVAQVGDLAPHLEAVADERGRLHLDVDPVQQGPFSGKVDADQPGIERGGEEAEGHPAAKSGLASKVLVQVQRIVVAGDLGK